MYVVHDRDRQQAVPVGVSDPVPALGVVAGARAQAQPVVGAGRLPLAFNQNWIYGFASYLMGMLLHVLRAGGAHPLARRGRAAQVVWLGVSTFLAYFGHVDAVVLLRRCARSRCSSCYARGSGAARCGRRWPCCRRSDSPSAPTSRSAREHTSHGEGLSALAGTWRDFPTLGAGISAPRAGALPRQRRSQHARRAVAHACRARRVARERASPRRDVRSAGRIADAHRRARR